MQYKDWSLREGDSLELMNKLAPDSVDGVITDPPYCSGGRRGSAAPVRCAVGCMTSDQPQRAQHTNMPSAAAVHGPVPPLERASKDPTRASSYRQNHPNARDCDATCDRIRCNWMRRLHCDQDEFYPRESEQSLDLAITSTRGYRDLDAFLADDRVLVRYLGAPGMVGGVAAPPRWDRWSGIIEHLLLFAGIDLSTLRPREVRVFADEWNCLAVAASIGDWYFWYCWETSA
jgi:hypothetical protein